MKDCLNWDKVEKVCFLTIDEVKGVTEAGPQDGCTASIVKKQIDTNKYIAACLTRFSILKQPRIPQWANLFHFIPVETILHRYSQGHPLLPLNLF